MMNEVFQSSCSSLDFTFDSDVEDDEVIIKDRDDRYNKSNKSLSSCNSSKSSWGSARNLFGRGNKESNRRDSRGGFLKKSFGSFGSMRNLRNAEFSGGGSGGFMLPSASTSSEDRRRQMLLSTKSATNSKRSFRGGLPGMGRRSKSAETLDSRKSRSKRNLMVNQEETLAILLMKELKMMES